MHGTLSAESRKGIPIRKKSTRNPVMITPHMIERMIMTTIITTSYQTTSPSLTQRREPKKSINFVANICLYSQKDTSSPGDEPGMFSHYNCRCRVPLDFKKISRFAFFLITL